MSDASLDDLRGILESHPSQPRFLLPTLQDLQARYKHLPETALRAVALRLGIPEAKVFAVANFYKAFSLVPKAERIFAVCQGTACHLRGAGGLIKALEDALGVKMNEASPDAAVGLESVNCLGACAMAPVATVDGEVHGSLDPAKAVALADEKGGLA